MATNKQGGTRANNVPMWRVLLIAPDSGLQHAADETQRIINALRPEVLLGEVTTTDVLDRIQAGTFDIVWFLGHSGPDGLQLSNGILSAAHLAQILRQCTPRLVVLNSCSSFAVANQLHDTLHCAIVCTVVDVADLDAYITGAALAHALAQGLDIAAAYAASRPPSNRVYVLLNGSLSLNGTDELDDLKRLVTRTAADLHGEIAGMARTTAAMQQQLEAIQQEQERVRAELTQQPERFAAALTRKRAAVWTVGFALFLAAYAILEFRDTLDVPMWVAIGFSLFVAAVAGWMFVWGIGFRLDR